MGYIVKCLKWIEAKSVVKPSVTQKRSTRHKRSGIHTGPQAADRVAPTPQRASPLSTKSPEIQRAAGRILKEETEHMPLHIRLIKKPEGIPTTSAVHSNNILRPNASSGVFHQGKPSVDLCLMLSHCYGFKGLVIASVGI
jgi:hypothetical protein